MPVRIEDVIDGVANGHYAAVTADELSRGRQGILNSISCLRTSSGGTSTGQCQHLRGVRPDDGWSGDVQGIQGHPSAPWHAYPHRVKYPWCVAACGTARSSNHGLSGLPVGSSGVDEYTVGNGGESLGFLGIVDHGRNRPCRQQHVSGEISHDDVRQALHQRLVSA